MTAFELEARVGGTAESRILTERSGAGDFDRVVDRYRRGAASEELRLALLPVADGLSRTISAWLADALGAAVRIGGRLEGGKLETTFTLYRCKGKAPETGWKKVDEWKLEVEDERVDHLADVQLPLPPAGLEFLVGQLAAFVTRVDVPEPEAPPETLPIPRP